MIVKTDGSFAAVERRPVGAGGGGFLHIVPHQQQQDLSRHLCIVRLWSPQHN